MAARSPRRSKVSNAPQAVADVVYDDLGAAEEECRMFRRRLAALAAQPVETFMTAASPGIIATTMLNAHYDSYEAYVFALAREMRKEYELIARQLHPADRCAGSRHGTYGAVPRQDRAGVRGRSPRCMSPRSTRRWPNIPRDRVRLHCCWGNYEGPHVHDVPLADVMPVLTGAKVGGLSIEFANPRHQHEYAA